MTGEVEPFVGPTPDRNLERALKLGAYEDRALSYAPKPIVEGALRRSVGLALEAVGCQAPVGGLCHLFAANEELFEA